MSYKKWVKRLSITACVVLAASVGYAFVRYVSTPSQSQILSSGATMSSTNNIDMFNNTPVAVHNMYFSFTYPAAMHAYPVQKLTAPELANYSYGYSDIESWQLSVSDQALVESSLNQDSAYVFRLQHPDQYQLSSLTINDQQVPVMTDLKSSGFSKLAFLLHGSDAVHVSLYGNDTSGTKVLDNVFMQVLKSITWSSN